MTNFRDKEYLIPVVIRDVGDQVLSGKLTFNQKDVMIQRLEVIRAYIDYVLKKIEQ